ncbi:RNA exonuclease 1 homolog isoform X1 [Xenopus laevis]|uniref:RNA exonuclease 1 homolog isoform X1 n=1 Tax=Xenopus laevis TaxID=8355 RepID=A0A8J0UZX0_XENLA|nr:RNA exonuclease 1 homolog isoform X1 [Xenopus laevis]
MLRPSGYFYNVECPFTPGQESFGCSRPHCQFRHVCPVGDGDGTQSDSDETVLTPAPAAETPKEALGKNKEELERINKAIEAVKNEVEEKQKKLLLYKSGIHSTPKSTTLLTDSNSNISSSLDMQEVADVQSNVPRNISKNNPNFKHCKKYVIDRRCPATDLEYDPLLNYSAGLFGGIAKEGGACKSKLPHDDDLEAAPCKKLRAASPIRLEIKLQASDDEDILVIDEPPLEANTEKQDTSKCNSTDDDKSMLFCDSIVENAAQMASANTEKGDVSLPDTAKHAKRETETKALNVAETCVMQSENINTDDKKLPCATPKVVYSYLPIQTEKCEPKHSPSSECSKENQKQLHLEGIMSASNQNDFCCKLDEKPLMENKNVFGTFGGSGGIDCMQASLPTIEQSSTVIELSAKPEQKCQLESPSPGTANDVIVLDSSSDAVDGSEAETDLSDSEDPMDECLRIFNEFAEKEATQHSKEVDLDHSEEFMTETKPNDMVPTQKKRIAHPSTKIDDLCFLKLQTKPSNSILVPYRGPAQQQIHHARILNVHQQAVQITAAVKSGQAFVASTQKRITGCITPAFNNLGQMVCVNLVEVQPILSSRSQFTGFLQGNKLGTSTLMNVPQKRTIQTIPIKATNRRKPSVGSESCSKVPHETRQRYVNSFVEEFLKVSATVQEAFDKALAEEKAIYDRCGSRNMYLSIAVNSLKKLRDQRSVPGGSKQPKTKVHASGLRKQDDKKDFGGTDLYNLLKEYVLSDEQLKDNGFPQPNPEKPGSALLHNAVTKSIGTDALRRVCCRCGETYSVTQQGKHVRKEECNYHSGKVLRHKVPGGIETRYSCCEAVVGTPGCQMAKLHVHDGQKENLDGFIKTFIKLPPSVGNPGVFSVDCEMCYTIQGLELTRVSVVDPSLQVVYDTFVKPDNEIIDYNTKFSGVTEDNLKNVSTSILDVQAVMLNMFAADTILIGHSLENDLLALKLIHDTVVDTSVVFPHRLGLPHKRALRNLMADYLRRIIQDNVAGHDSTEDATACMELIIWKVKEDTKGKR